MWPILLCSIITIGIVIERYFVLRQASVNVPRFMIQIRELMKKGDIVEAINYCSEYNSPIANIIRKGLSKYHFGMERIKESIESAGKQEIYKLEKGLSVLATISGVAPLLGFLGTVTGMISAFMRIESLGGNASPSDLAGGIWEALLTTAFGLSVGIIAYLFYNYFVTRINKLISEMEITSTDFIDVLYEKEHGKMK
ncbi:MAG: MotA/TolQ/ExbB proton channel family protein [Ignavibacteria bacterium]|nr:MotA/TolQ/ExbB proton channel family protein [Ignavibacteria bacterium]MDH7526627.1 MotA/TolQ/ExbB proton channel family protein [Ignavibacteria bacterium]